MTATDRYIPALGLRKLTRLYDPLIRWFMPEDKFKRHLIDQANIERTHRILDVGCGTGTLMILIKQKYPEVRVCGIDGDQSVLRIAQEKAEKAKLELDLKLGMAFELPYLDNSFERVFSTLMLHHLATSNKGLAIKEAFRVLTPGGEFHVADFGKPHNRAANMISLILRRLEQASDNIKGLIPDMLNTAGFEQIKETAHYKTIFGTLVLLRARKPESANPEFPGL